MDQDALRPSREEIEDRWVALIEDRATRDEVSDWARRCFEQGGIDDRLIQTGLGQLFSANQVSLEGNPPGLAQPPPVGEYLWTMPELAEKFNRWKLRCAEVDANPTKLPQIEYDVRLRLPDGREVAGMHFSTFHRRAVGETINVAVGPDGRGREGFGFIWRIADIEEQSENSASLVLDFVRAHPRQELEWPLPQASSGLS